MSQNIQYTGLNEVQIGLLRMFDRNIPENDIREIKQVLVKHLSKQLLDEVDRVVDEKGITEADFKKLEKEHFRTKSKKRKLVACILRVTTIIRHLA